MKVFQKHIVVASAFGMIASPVSAEVNAHPSCTNRGGVSFLQTDEVRRVGRGAFQVGRTRMVRVASGNPHSSSDRLSEARLLKLQFPTWRRAQKFEAGHDGDAVADMQAVQAELDPNVRRKNRHKAITERANVVAGTKRNIEEAGTKRNIEEALLQWKARALPSFTDPRKVLRDYDERHQRRSEVITYTERKIEEAKIELRNFSKPRPATPPSILQVASIQPANIARAREQQFTDRVLQQAQDMIDQAAGSTVFTASRRQFPDADPSALCQLYGKGLAVMTALLKSLHEMRVEVGTKVGDEVIKAISEFLRDGEPTEDGFQSMKVSIDNLRLAEALKRPDPRNQRRRWIFLPRFVQVERFFGFVFGDPQSEVHRIMEEMKVDDDILRQLKQLDSPRDAADGSSEVTVTLKPDEAEQLKTYWQAGPDGAGAHTLVAKFDASGQEDVTFSRTLFRLEVSKPGALDGWFATSPEVNSKILQKNVFDADVTLVLKRDPFVQADKILKENHLGDSIQWKRDLLQLKEWAQLKNAYKAQQALNDAAAPACDWRTVKDWLNNTFGWQLD